MIVVREREKEEKKEKEREQQKAAVRSPACMIRTRNTTVSLCAGRDVHNMRWSSIDDQANQMTVELHRVYISMYACVANHR